MTSKRELETRLDELREGEGDGPTNLAEVLSDLMAADRERGRESERESENGGSDRGE